jgi:hypothetical protein
VNCLDIVKRGETVEEELFAYSHLISEVLEQSGVVLNNFDFLIDAESNVIKSQMFELSNDLLDVDFVSFGNQMFFGMVSFNGLKYLA